MNSENAFKKLGQKLMNGEITPEEHVKEYNKLLRELAEKYDRKYSVYSTHWSSFRALKRHLIANNESIKFVKIS